jgi:hypothetical protein
VEKKVRIVKPKVGKKPPIVEQIKTTKIITEETYD